MEEKTTNLEGAIQQENKKSNAIRYIKSAGVGAGLGAIAAVGIDYLGHLGVYTNDVSANEFQSAFAGAVFGAGVGALRTASKLHKRLKPVYYGAVAFGLYGLVAGSISAISGTPNACQSLIYRVCRISSFANDFVYGFLSPGIETAQNFEMGDWEFFSKVHSGIRNSGLWAMSGGVVGGSIGYAWNKIKRIPRSEK